MKDIAVLPNKQPMKNLLDSSDRGINLTIHIKDPGSAITHFIGMIMAVLAAWPLLLKAAQNPDRLYLIAMSIYAASLILLYAASTTYHTFDKSPKVNTLLKKIDHMMISVLITWENWNHPSDNCMEHRYYWYPDQGILGLLPEMGVFHSLYRYGMDLYSCSSSNSRSLIPCGIRMALGWGNHVYRRRSDLCIKAFYL